VDRRRGGGAGDDRGRAALTRGDSRAAWAPANLTLNVADRGLLAGHDAQWLDQRPRDLDELALRALDCMARVGLALGGSELAAADRAARRMIEREPFRESGYRRLMEVHAARGDAPEALVVYERLRTLLREELGTTPGPELQQLHRRLLDVPSTSARTGPAGEVEWLGAPEAQIAPGLPPYTPPAIPASLQFDRPLVGRAELLRRMRAAWDGAGNGHRGMIVLEGEAGIGKTRLGGELAQGAHEAGGTVLYGRCDDDMVVAYQPIVEAVTGYLAGCSSAPLTSMPQLGPCRWPPAAVMSLGGCSSVGPRAPGAAVGASCSSRSWSTLPGSG
jgi:hypothetical protein